MKSSSSGKPGIGIWEFISKKLINRSPDYINDRWYFNLSIDERVISLVQEIKNKKKSE